MQLFCPSCNGSLPDWFLRSSRTRNTCPSCYSPLDIEIFPAFFRHAAGPPDHPLALEEGSCYEHASRRAVALCHQCGRFLCALCEVELDGKVWCPACLRLDTPRKRPPVLERERTLYDSIALAISTLPVLLFYPIFLTPPLVVYLAARYWKAPSSLIPRNKWRFVLALCFAALELCLVALLVVGFVMALRTRSFRVQPH